MHLKIVVLAGALLLPLAIRAAGDAPLDRATLHGRGAVNVIVDVLDEDLKKQGITESLVREEIEKRLDHAGITVNHSATEFVGIRILQVRGQRGPYALCLSIGVYQPVTLVRDKELKTATETWAVETILMADAKVVNRQALTSVDELTDRLVTAYRAVNPKP
jgi:hypothetical protein